MKCPFCGFENSKVLDSRNSSEGRSIKRRRECIECKKRFNTYETIEKIPIIVVKKDKSREEFDRSKIMKGLLRACAKRNINRETLENILLDIEKDIQSNLNGEISSNTLGEIIMQKLKTVDEVAYIRFASVYKEFSDLESFMKEIEKIRYK